MKHMKDHSLIKLLSTFSSSEIREFGEFLKTGYFNKRKAVRDLFVALRDFHPGYDGKRFQKERIFGKIFPGKKFNESTFRVLLHYLNESARKFITIKRFEKDQLEYEHSLKSELYDRNLIRNVGKDMDKAIGELDPKTLLSENYFFHKARLEYEKLFYLSNEYAGVYEKFLEEADFQKVFENVTNYYYIRSMRLYLNILNIEAIYSKKFKKEKFEMMMKNFQIDKNSDAIMIHIYYSLINMLTDEKDELHFRNVKKLFTLAKDKMYADDISEVFVNMQNYCKRKVSQGRKEYEMELFRLISEEVDLKSYLRNGLMSNVYYRNAVNAALKVNQADWAKAFIEEYKEEIETESRQNLYNYCLALCEFHEKNFEASLELLSKVKYKDLYQKLDARILLMMIYFELGEQDSLYSLIESYRQFLINDDLIPERRKVSYVNFYKYLNKIIALRKKKDIHGVSKLIKLLEQEKSTSNKDWLMQKLEEAQC